MTKTVGNNILFIALCSICSTISIIQPRTKNKTKNYNLIPTHELERTTTISNVTSFTSTTVKRIVVEQRTSLNLYNEMRKLVSYEIIA